MSADEEQTAGRVDVVTEPHVAIDEFFSAASNHDWQGIEALLAPDFMFYTDNALVLTREEFLMEMKKDAMVIQHMELYDIEYFASVDNSLAFVRYRLTLLGKIRNVSHNVETIESVVLRKGVGDQEPWLFVQNHASLKPLSRDGSNDN